MRISTRSAVVSAAVAVVVAIAAIAYAATLAVTPGTLTASQTTVAACATGSVTLTYPAPTDSGTGFQIASVTAAISAGDVTSCSGKKLYLNLTDGTALVASGPGAGIAVATSMAVTLTWTAGKSLANVTTVDVAIH